MEFSSRADVLDLRNVNKLAMNAVPHFIRKIEDKGKSYSFYELLTRKNSRLGSLHFLNLEVGQNDPNDKTLGFFARGSLVRMFCVFFFESTAQRFITAVLITIYSVMIPFIDMQTLVSRSTALVYFSRSTVLAVLYISHIWFLLRSLVSKCE